MTELIWRNQPWVQPSQQRIGLLTAALIYFGADGFIHHPEGP